ncbi:MAG: peptidoglycan-binding protein [Bacillota bacterium]|nr:peptidoglycan-binding protein [Bacillota bacterium]
MWMRRVVLRQGDRNPAVAVLQERLELLGYEISDPPQIFGPSTRTAVIAFQQRKGLCADGIVGEGTWRALYEATGGSASLDLLQKTPLSGQGRKNCAKYVVQPGDTLLKVARKFNTTPARLAALNNLLELSLIFPGDVLLVPEGPE